MAPKMKAMKGLAKKGVLKDATGKKSVLKVKGHTGKKLDLAALHKNQAVTLEEKMNKLRESATAEGADGEDTHR
jgi:hypothetical protein